MQKGSRIYYIGNKNNFDHLRLFLAIGVFFYHTFELTQNNTFLYFNTYISTWVVHSFFIISGFLIFMSYERSSSLKSYFEKRLRRIVPAYLAVIFVSFIFFGFFSTLPIKEYFSSMQSWQYLFSNLSTFNFLQPILPGVFLHNHYNVVNGALWTIKIELMFYLSVPFIVYLYRYLGKTKTLVVIFLLSALYYLVLDHFSIYYQQPVFTVLQRQLPGQMMFFSSGALLYYYHQSFMKYQHLFFLLAIAMLVTGKYFFFYPLYTVSLSIIVIYIATAIPYLGHIAKYGDLSYGIYIWHFPLIQVFISLHFFDTSPWISFVSLFILILFLSWLLWHIIEKPFLSKKSHYVQEDRSTL